MPKLPLHLVKRGKNFYFRRASGKLSALLGMAEIKIALRTSDAICGKARAGILSSAVELIFRDLTSMAVITNEAIRERARDYLKAQLSRSLEFALIFAPDPTVCVPDEIAYLETSEADLREKLANQHFDPFIQSDALKLLGISTPEKNFKASEAVQFACNAIIRAKIENARILREQLLGNYKNTNPLDPWFEGVVATDLPLLPGEKPSVHSLASVSQQFFDFKSKQDWTAKTAADVKRVLVLAENIIGAERPLKSLSVEDVKRVRDALSLLPPNYMKSSEGTKLTVKEAIASNSGGAALSVKTQEKYFTMFRQLLIWASNEGYLDKVPGAGVKVAGTAKLVPGEQRDPYSLDQLKRIFFSPLYTGHKSALIRHRPGSLLMRDGKFWVPLIALYSGMRMGEIVQLLASDIKVESDTWYFDVSKGEGKSLKTISSKRRIPIHRVLIEVGFLEHVKQFTGGQRLFPEIEKGKDGYHSHNLSKWWGRYSQQAKFKSPKTAFHSFRHNFLDALQQQGLPEYLNKALMGHADKSVHGQYSSGLKITALKDAIDKVCYDFEIPHLASST